MIFELSLSLSPFFHPLVSDLFRSLESRSILQQTKRTIRSPRTIHPKIQTESQPPTRTCTVQEIIEKPTIHPFPHHLGSSTRLHPARRVMDTIYRYRSLNRLKDGYFCPWIWDWDWIFAYGIPWIFLLCWYVGDVGCLVLLLDWRLEGGGVRWTIISGGGAEIVRGKRRRTDKRCYTRIRNVIK